MNHPNHPYEVTQYEKSIYIGPGADIWAKTDKLSKHRRPEISKNGDKIRDPRGALAARQARVRAPYIP